MACTDVQTIQAGNGTKTQFSFDFPYIFKSEIHVYFWNVVTKEYDEKLTTDATYPWRITDANPTIVEFTGAAPPSPSAPTDPNEPTVDNVKIRRITKVDDIRALFNPGSAIRSDDLNKNFEQLRYAIQESNCAGISDELDQYLKDYYWDRYDNTLYNGDTWVSNDTKIATTAALDARFQDEVNDTLTKAELAAASYAMPNNDNAVPTTGAVNDYIDQVITNDIAGSDGVSITDDGDGTITVGLTDDSVDLNKIKHTDKIRLIDQSSNYQIAGSNNTIFTSSAAIRRFENYVQTSTPSPTAGIGKGAVWLDNDQDLTLSVWSGSAWIGVASGGTFTNQPKVVYVDATSGLDSNDGHRISRPKQSIKAAINQINADATYGDGSVVIVAPGVYQEAAPIQIQKKNVSIIGEALRSCIVHPTVATQGYQSSGNHALFELNSGSFIQNLTLTGMKAGTGTGNSVDAVLPTAQGWNFAFYAGATITKSPYVQNCTNFSDSEIDNSNLNANTPAGGLAGDLDSAPTGGGMLVDGSVVDSASPLRSMVADSYTHVGLNGPGILVTNNGYTQCTSSYAFFNKYHIKALNGGQANLAASTTDFGEKSLVADGKSTTAIFTASTTAAAANGAISFTINAPVADASWHGSAERPASNMLVTLNGVTYPVLSATANGSGWNVTISRPNPSQKSQNLGLNGAVASGSSAQFFLRSLIASSGHTMEYVGSGTDYRALPENGGVPDDSNQITELNDGKIWTATTDHNGKFTVGPLEVDQRSGAITIASGSQVTNLIEDPSPQLGGSLDVNGNSITSTSNANIVLDPNGTGTVDVSSSRITNVTDPTGAQDAATKAYVDALSTNSISQGNTSATVTDTGTDGKFVVTTEGSERLRVNSTGDVSVDAPTALGKLHVRAANECNFVVREESTALVLSAETNSGRDSNRTMALEGGLFTFSVSGNEKARISPTGDVSVGTPTALGKLHVRAADEVNFVVRNDSNAIVLSSETNAGRDSNRLMSFEGSYFNFTTSGTERLTLQSDGKFGISTSAPASRLQIGDNTNNTANVIVFGQRVAATQTNKPRIGQTSDGSGNDLGLCATSSSGAIRFFTGNGDGGFGAGSNTERVRINSAGYVGINVTNPAYQLDVQGYLRVGEISGLGLIQLGKSSTTNKNYHIGADSGGGFQIWNGNIGSGTSKLTVSNTGDLTTFGNVIVRGNTTEGGEIQLRNPSRTVTGAYLDVGGNDNPRWFSVRNNMVMQIGQLGGTNGTITFHTTSGAERMRVANNGHLMIHNSLSSTPGNGNTTTGSSFEKAGDGSSLYVSRGSNAACVFNRNSVGNLVKFMRSGSEHGRVIVNANSSVSYSTNSDYRLKENVVVLNNAIDRVKQLLPKRFNFIGNDVVVDGFLAHEAQTVVPEAVDGTHNQTEPIGTLTEWDETVLETDVVEPDNLTWEEGVTDEDGNQSTVTRTRTWTETGTKPVYQSIDQAKLVPLLTAALQEAIAKIETLETKVAALEAAN